MKKSCFLLDDLVFSRKKNLNFRLVGFFFVSQVGHCRLVECEAINL